MNADSCMSQSKDSKSTLEVWGALETDEESTPRCMTVLLNDPGPRKTRLTYILVQVKHGDRKLEGSRRIFLQDENVDQGQVSSAQHRCRKSCSHSTKLGEAQLREAGSLRSSFGSLTRNLDTMWVHDIFVCKRKVSLVIFDFHDLSIRNFRRWHYTFNIFNGLLISDVEY